MRCMRMMAAFASAIRRDWIRNLGDSLRNARMAMHGQANAADTRCSQRQSPAAQAIRANSTKLGDLWLESMNLMSKIRQFLEFQQCLDQIGWSPMTR